jgi:hypothetical protein
MSDDERPTAAEQFAAWFTQVSTNPAPIFPQLEDNDETESDQ